MTPVTMLRGTHRAQPVFACRETLFAMPTHYALVDFENVQPDLASLAGRLTK